MRRYGRLAVLVLAAAGAVAAGCNSKASRLQSFLQEQPGPVEGTQYRVLPPDTISVRSIHVPEINGVRQQVRPDGNVNLPLIGEIYVAGKTPKEIEGAIVQASTEYYKQSDATVSVDGFTSQKVYVFGQVARPGPQPWTGTNTLVDVLALSQPTQLAWPERIRLVRGGAPKRGGHLPGEAGAEEPAAGGQATKQSEPDVLVINMMSMVESGDMSQNVLLQPDDVLYVPPNPLAAVGLAIQQVLFPIRPAAEAIYLPASAANAAVLP